MQNSSEMIQRLENDIKNEVVKNLTALSRATSAEFIRFLSDLHIEKVQGFYVKYQIPVEEGEMQAAFTGVDMRVVGEDQQLSIGISEYYDVASQTFKNTDVLINPDWESGTEVVGEEFHERFNFFYKNENVVHTFFEKINLHKRLKAIEESVFSEENGELAI